MNELYNLLYSDEWTVQSYSDEWTVQSRRFWWINYTISYILMNELFNLVHSYEWTVINIIKMITNWKCAIKKLIIWNIWREYVKTDRVIEVEQGREGQGGQGQC